MLVKRDHKAPESGTRLIDCVGGSQAIIDNDDWPRIHGYQWYIRRRGGVKYAYRKKISGGKSFMIFMHRQITHCPNDKVVHHINHDGLDNRKANLLKMTTDQHKKIHSFT